MQRVGRRTVLPVTPHDLWLYLADLRNLPEWLSGVTTAQVTSPGPIGPGTTLRVERLVNGRPIAAPLEVIAWEPSRRLGLVTTIQGVHAEAFLHLAPFSGGARTELAFEMSVRAGGLMSLAEKMIARGADAEVVGTLDRLHARFGGAAPA